ALLMRVLDGAANLNEKIEPFARGKVILLAIVCDLDTAHQFHDEVRAARLGRAAVEHFRDVRMLHHRQRLSLGIEASDNLLGVHTQLDDLERNSPPNRFLLVSHIYHAAAAFADLFEEFEAANSVARLLGGLHTRAYHPTNAQEMGVAFSGVRFEQ